MTAVLTSPPSLLVVDDEPDLRTLYELTLLREGYDIETAGSVEEALQHLEQNSYQLVITDMRLPDGSGLDLLRHLDSPERREKTIVITAYGSAENAVEALKAGAYDYLTKPVDLKQFRAVVASALGRQSTAAPGAAATAAAAAAQMAAASTALPSGVPVGQTTAARAGRTSRPVAVVGTGAVQRMAGHSPAIQQVRALVQKVARSMAPVLIQGESGTGKELVARAVHEASARGLQPFIAVNCGAIPEHLLESEFFGYRKGAFTGAAEDRGGFFQAADGGTLFLDEIGDLPLAMQSKLLRVAQERAVRPVGATAETPIDVRLLSATHKDLAAEVLAGRFRQDLFYRLNVIQIRVPALRERLQDLQAISEQFLARIAQDAGVGPPPRLSAEALQHLARYSFPGNVRELENLLHRALALSGQDTLGLADLGLPDIAFVPSSSAPVFAEAAPRQESGVVGSAGRAHPAPDTDFPTLPDLPELPAWPATGLAATPSVAEAPTPAASWSEDGPAGARRGTAPVPATLPEGLPQGVCWAAVVPCDGELPSDLALYLDAVERAILLRALELHRNNRTAAGASMGLSLRQMRYRMARLNITVGGDGAAEG